MKAEQTTERENNKNEPRCMSLCVRVCVCFMCVRSVASEKKCMTANCYCDITRFCGWHQPNFPISLFQIEKV